MSAARSGDVHRILLATDFSTAGRPALRRAIEWARRRRARLHLVHVITPPPVVLEDSFFSARAWRRMQAEAIRGARRRLRALEARARAAGVRASSTVILSVVPFDAVVRAARRLGADLIVVGTHGRTGLARLALGSVAERVAALAPCPVLVVRGG
jgi:nucleotide-binding universal stress UspA family protein